MQETQVFVKVNAKNRFVSMVLMSFSELEIKRHLIVQVHNAVRQAGVDPSTVRMLWLVVMEDDPVSVDVTLKAGDTQPADPKKMWRLVDTAVREVFSHFGSRSRLTGSMTLDDEIAARDESLVASAI